MLSPRQAWQGHYLFLRSPFQSLSLSLSLFAHLRPDPGNRAFAVFLHMKFHIHIGSPSCSSISGLKRMEQKALIKPRVFNYCTFHGNTLVS